MKKLFLLPVLALLLTVLSCNKKANPTPSATPPTTTTSTIPADGWMLGTTKYKQALTVRQESQFVVNALDGTTGAVNTFAAFFKTYPTASGKYKVVTYTPTSDKPYAFQWINEGEVVIVATVPGTTGGNNKTHYSLSESLEATITVTGGKIKVEVPEITVRDANNNQQKLTGTILEN
jgi:predicted SnoaL-like aldol condensation-catalyzing enzyme